ncbi:hypothetical protein Hanom_Chr11g01064271 [Helianthus anomalus]
MISFIGKQPFKYGEYKVVLSLNQGRFLEGHWQGHGLGKFFGRSANFPHFDRNFLYILFFARAFFSARVPGTFNGQDPTML